MDLSTRGRRLVDAAPMPEYIHVHFAHGDDAWSEDNPAGYIGLAIAENKLVWDLLEPRFNARRQVPAEAAGYDNMLGSEDFRGRLAAFLGSRLFGRSIDPAHVAVLNGAGSVLELVFYALADPGDGVLVPTPSYAGFWADLETRDELTILPVHTRADEGFRLTVDHLDAAVAGAGRPVRALLLASPSNPLGRVYPRPLLEDILAWAESRDLHVVFDELFALSVFGDTPFVSGGSLRPRRGSHTHVVWAASKDLAASGLRCGALVTENEDLLAAVDGLAYWAGVSGDTQHLVGEMLADRPWIDAFVAENQRRLGDAYARVTAALEAAGIAYLPGEAGFFFLVDVRRFLAEQTWSAEDALWRRLVDEAKVNLTPGAACRIAEPGFLRLCFAAVPPEQAVAGVGRLAAVLGVD